VRGCQYYSGLPHSFRSCMKRKTPSSANVSTRLHPAQGTVIITGCQGTWTFNRFRFPFNHGIYFYMNKNMSQYIPNAFLIIIMSHESDKASSDLYLGGVRFESRPGRRLSLSLSRQMTGQFIIHNHPIIRPHTVWVPGSFHKWTTQAKPRIAHLSM
jgi:hypothetical protein